ncbi:unnamed protein product [Rotaria sp. Silwood2]|nr:unnamed protein product [Rotaria sp. Silwood2]
MRPNQFSHTSFIVQSSFSTRLFNVHQTPNTSLPAVSFSYKDRNRCFDNSKPSHQTLSKITHHNKLINYVGFLVRSHSLFYCSVPQVATRTLLTFITYLHIRDDLIPLLKNHSIFNNNLNFTSNLNIFNGVVLNQMLLPSTQNYSPPSLNNSIAVLESFLSRLTVLYNNENSKKVDFWAMLVGNNLPLTRLRTLSDPSILFSPNFTRAIFVRHPFERLASAYVDKIALFKHGSVSSFDPIRLIICQKYSSFYLTKAEEDFYHTRKPILKKMKQPCQKIIPKFEHFIRYMMSTGLSGDVHWQPYSKLCHVCLFKYNFIGKYETITEDLRRLRSYLGIKSINPDNKNYFKTGKTTEYYKSLYSNLSNELICDLKYFYEDDLKLFDYRLEDYLIDQRTIQCSSSHK